MHKGCTGSLHAQQHPIPIPPQARTLITHPNNTGLHSLLPCSDRTDAETALAAVSDWMADTASSQNAVVALVAGLVFVAEENYIDALKACHQGRSLEQMALCVQVRARRGSFLMTLSP